MQIVFPHHTDRATARRKLEARLQDLLGQHGHYLTDITQHWEGDRLVFSGTAKGFKASGSVDITDSDVIVAACWAEAEPAIANVAATAVILMADFLIEWGRWLWRRTSACKCGN